LNGVTVEFAAPAQLQLAKRWQLQLEEWSASTGGQVHLHEPETDDDWPPTLKTATLAIIPLYDTPDLIAADWMAPLSESETAQHDWDDVLRGLRNGVAQPGGIPKLIPVACPVLACYYRADLLEAAGRKPPQTWEEYRSLLDDLDQWSKGLPALEPWDEGFRDSILLARAAPFALHPDNVAILLDLQSGEPLIDTPPFVAALEDGLAALQRLDPESLHSTPDKCVQAVLEGRAALAIGLPPISADHVARDSNAVVGAIQLPGATRVYERSAGDWVSTPDGKPSYVTLVGYEGYALCAAGAASTETRTAGWGLWEFLQESSDNENLPFGPAVCRQRDIPAAMHRPQAGFTAAEWRQQVDATVAALQQSRVLLESPLPQCGRFRVALTIRISEVINGTQPPARALELAADDWRALIKELGTERVLNVYRQCHGLSPL
jgi:hypothetical protein